MKVLQAENFTCTIKGQIQKKIQLRIVNMFSFVSITSFLIVNWKVSPMKKHSKSLELLKDHYGYRDKACL